MKRVAKELYGGGATYNHILFPGPISALFLDVTWTEDGWLELDFGGTPWSDEFPELEPYRVGFLLDEPQQTIGIVCDHTWCHIDAVYWQAVAVPEPTTALLLILVAAGMCARQNRTAKSQQLINTWRRS